MKITTAILLTAALLLQAGCATKRVVFATKTNLGLDVSGTSQFPDKVSFTYGRYEGAIVPRSVTGDPYSVFGGLDADVNFFGSQTIHQIFATGNAAVIAANQAEEEPELTEAEEGDAFTTKSLFFVTDTSFGLKLSAGKQDISPTLMLGYKRVEGTIIPVEKTEREVRSVYADITINSSETTRTDVLSSVPFPQNKGVRITQGFATGRAAELRAGEGTVKAALSAASSPSAAEFAKKRFEEKDSSIDKIVQHVVENGAVNRDKLLALATPGTVLRRKLESEIPAHATPLQLTTVLKEKFHPNQIHELQSRIR